MKLSGWGKYPVVDCQGRSFASLPELRRGLAGFADVIVHARGWSYGDSALYDRVLLSRRFDKILAFDPVVGTVTCESGVTLAELLDAFLPRGWFLPVAPGERGRSSNYLYGAAKGALTLYLGGLRNRLHSRGVRVLTVLPEFVDTKMTEHLDLPAKLLATPEEVAGDVYRAYKKGKEIVYTKMLWKWIMMVIKTIPEKIFKRLSL